MRVFNETFDASLWVNFGGTSPEIENIKPNKINHLSLESSNKYHYLLDIKIGILFHHLTPPLAPFRSSNTGVSRSQ